MSNLTDKSIRAMPPTLGKQYSISDNGMSGVRGLSIMINPGGTKVFYFRYKTPARKTKRIRIGVYPCTSLSNARKKAREYKRELDEGTDLATLTNKAQLAKREIHTILELWNEYHLDALTRKKSAIFEAQLWRKHLEEHFGSLDVRSFTRDTLLDFLLPYRRNHSPSLAARIQAILSQLGAYAVERRVLEFSPAYQLGKKKPLPTRDRFLSRYELSVFWNTLSDITTLKMAKVSLSLSIALKLTLCTCARRAEVAGMEWSEIDFESNSWTIPAERTKNGRAHVVPLTKMILELLSESRKSSHKPNSRFVFPGRRAEKITKGAGHIRADALTRACSRLCSILIDEYEIEKFTPHDLRRTGATYLASALKIDRFTISQLLNHVSDHGGGAAVTAIYARYDYFEEKSKALTAWTEFIMHNAKAYSTKKCA